ncbi:MAG TPA: GDSL-type esterase/lipase family protein [Ilumatobacter sp.]|nr:GDSL-type esterase/lipase family protein [Ilumatobacter sp.]
MIRRWPVLCVVLLVGALAVTGCGGDDEAAATTVESVSPDVVALDVLGSVGPVSSTAGGDLATVLLRPSTVAVVGDSLALSAEDEIRAALSAGSVDIVGFDGRENRRVARALPDLPSGVDAVAALGMTVDPKLWIVALGTNDVGAQQSPEDFRADVDALLAEIPAEDAVIWLDVWIQSRVEGSVAANAVLREAAAERPGMSVVNWFQYGDDPGMIRDDGIHLDDAGREKFAEVMLAEVDQRFGPA